MTNFEDILDKATETSTFSVLEAIKGTAYPRDEITVYTDAASAYEIKVLLSRIADEKDDDAVNALDEEREALVEKINASGLTFHLHGFAPEIVAAINASAAAHHEVETTDYGPAGREANFRYLAEAIERVEDASGAVDSHHWSFEEIESLQDQIPEEEFDRLMVKMEEVVFAALVFESKVTADFS